MNLKKGDSVMIMSGKDRKKTGVILNASPDGNTVVVEAINMFKKRSRPKKQGEKGQTVLVPRPLAASRVMLVCPSCKKPTRVGRRIEGGRSIRYCKKCKSSI